MNREQLSGMQEMLLYFCSKRTLLFLALAIVLIPANIHAQSVGSVSLNASQYTLTFRNVFNADTLNSIGNNPVCPEVNYDINVAGNGNILRMASG